MSFVSIKQIQSADKEKGTGEAWIWTLYAQNMRIIDRSKRAFKRAHHAKADFERKRKIWETIISVRVISDKPKLRRAKTIIL